MLCDPVPNFRLYGETGGNPLPDVVHVETLRDRSSQHDWEIQPHRHGDLCQIMCFEKTDVNILLNDRSMSVSAPALLLVPPTVVHGFRFAPDVVGTVTTIPIEFSDEWQRDRVAKLQPRLVRPTNYNFAHLWRLLQDVEAEYRANRPARDWAIHALVRLVFIWFERTQLRADLAIEPVTVSNRKARIARFLSLVEAHFVEGWTIADYAREAGVSKAQLGRDCRAILDQSALQVVQDRRIEEARRKLAYTDWSISSIAIATGFADLGHFSRFFRHRTRETPSTYRARVRSRPVVGRDGGAGVRLMSREKDTGAWPRDGN